MQSLKRSEQLVGIDRIEAGAVVTHIECRRAPTSCRAHLDRGVIATAGELPGVVEQVLERDAQQPWVARGAQVGRNRDGHLARRRLPPELGDDLRCEIAEIDALGLHVGARDLRQRQDVVDQLAHPLGRVADALDVPSGLRRQGRPGVLDQRLAEAVDAAQRRTQIVRDRVAERLELAVCVLQRAVGRFTPAHLPREQHKARREQEHAQRHGARDVRDHAAGFAPRPVAPFAQQTILVREHVVEERAHGGRLGLTPDRQRPVPRSMSPRPDPAAATDAVRRSSRRSILGISSSSRRCCEALSAPSCSRHTWRHSRHRRPRRVESHRPYPDRR